MKQERQFGSWQLCHTSIPISHFRILLATQTYKAVGNYHNILSSCTNGLLQVLFLCSYRPHSLCQLPRPVSVTDKRCLHQAIAFSVSSYILKGSGPPLADNNNINDNNNNDIRQQFLQQKWRDIVTFLSRILYSAKVINRAESRIDCCNSISKCGSPSDFAHFLPLFSKAVGYTPPCWLIRHRYRPYNNPYLCCAHHDPWVREEARH